MTSEDVVRYWQEMMKSSPEVFIENISAGPGYVRVCEHTGDAARIRELEARLRHSEANNDALDAAVRTAHAQIARLEWFIREKGLEREAKIRATE